MITIPEAFVTAVMRLDNRLADQWLSRLPRVVSALCRRWGLDLDGEPMHGGLSLVVPVQRGAERCVLKLVQTEADAEAEAAALTTWGGRGAVRLLDADLPRGALLLERLDASRSTRELPVGEAFIVAGHLLRRLAVPAPPGVPLLRDVAARLAGELPARAERLKRLVPQGVLDQACRAASALGPAAGDRLVHTDLHDDNILAGVREPWLAIDPKVIAGDPAFGVAPLLWRRIDEMAGSAELHRHLASISSAAELDLEQARAWSLVRCVDYWLWGLSVGLTEDPVRCERLAAWLMETE